MILPDRFAVRYRISLNSVLKGISLPELYMRWIKIEMKENLMFFDSFGIIKDTEYGTGNNFKTGEAITGYLFGIAAIAVVLGALLLVSKNRGYIK